MKRVFCGIYDDCIWVINDDVDMGCWEWDMILGEFMILMINFMLYFCYDC